MALNPRIQAIPQEIAQTANPNDRIQAYLSSLRDHHPHQLGSLDEAPVSSYTPRRSPPNLPSHHANDGGAGLDGKGKVKTGRKYASLLPRDTLAKPPPLSPPQFHSPGHSVADHHTYDHTTSRDDAEQRLHERKLRRRAKAAILKPTPPPLKKKKQKLAEERVPDRISPSREASPDEWWDQPQRRRVQISPSRSPSVDLPPSQSRREAEKTRNKRRKQPLGAAFNYKPSNVYTSRLTLRHQPTTGLFSKGKASDPHALDIAKSGNRSSFLQSLLPRPSARIPARTTEPENKGDWRDLWRAKPASGQSAVNLPQSEQSPPRRAGSPQARDSQYKPFAHLPPAGNTNSTAWPSTIPSTTSSSKFRPIRKRSSIAPSPDRSVGPSLPLEYNQDHELMTPTFDSLRQDDDLEAFWTTNPHRLRQSQAPIPIYQVPVQYDSLSNARLAEQAHAVDVRERPYITDLTYGNDLNYVHPEKHYWASGTAYQQPVDQYDDPLRLPFNQFQALPTYEEPGPFAYPEPANDYPYALEHQHEEHSLPHDRRALMEFDETYGYHKRNFQRQEDLYGYIDHGCLAQEEVHRYSALEDIHERTITPIRHATYDSHWDVENPFLTSHASHQQPLTVHQVVNQCYDNQSWTTPQASSRAAPGTYAYPASVSHRQPFQPSTNQHYLGNHRDWESERGNWR